MCMALLEDEYVAHGISQRRRAPAGPPYTACVMPRINEAYLNLRAAYLFAEIRRRQGAFASAHPDARVIDLGIGDVTRPLPAAAVRALHEAADDMARPDTFKGYGPYVGYEWLRAEIATQDFGTRGVRLAADEVFISDGGKSDSANLQETFAGDCVVGVMDPVLSRVRRRHRPLRGHGLPARRRRERLPA